jgi:polyferredoxin
MIVGISVALRHAFCISLCPNSCILHQFLSKLEALFIFTPLKHEFYLRDF